MAIASLSESVEEQLERLAAMTLEERVAVPGIEPGRAPVIVAGIVVLARGHG